METVSLELAFSRHGASAPRGQRALCATAEDGSLVLVCQSSGFSRPDAGVLRYSARLSLLTAGRPQVEALRLGLGAASEGGTPVRLIIRTPDLVGTSSKVHMRADLVGSVSAFDGDAYSVDFVRLVDEEPVTPPVRSRRRR
jgi:hypothetical protein